MNICLMLSVPRSNTKSFFERVVGVSGVSIGSYDTDTESFAASVDSVREFFSCLYVESVRCESKLFMYVIQDIIVM